MRIPTTTTIATVPELVARRGDPWADMVREGDVGALRRAFDVVNRRSPLPCSAPGVGRNHDERGRPV